MFFDGFFPSIMWITSVVFWRFIFFLFVVICFTTLNSIFFGASVFIFKVIFRLLFITIIISILTILWFILITLGLVFTILGLIFTILGLVFAILGLVFTILGLVFITWWLVCILSIITIWLRWLICFLIIFLIFLVWLLLLYLLRHLLEQHHPVLKTGWWLHQLQCSKAFFLFLHFLKYD